MPPAPTQQHRLPGKAAFLAKYKISASEFRDTGLRWADLQAIFDDYSKLYEQLIPHVECLAAILRQCPAVHAAKSRVKKPESLVEKIVRRSVEKRSPWAAPFNYVKVVPDLMGIRALYLLQAQWPTVNTFIRRTLPIKLKPKPVSFIQTPIPSMIRSAFEAGGCTVKVGKDGYQSVHYEMIHQVGSRDIRVEVQARTLCQEAWGEISHITAYPYRKNVALLVRSMCKLSDLTVKADHFSSTVAVLSQIHDAIEAGHRPDPDAVDEYNRFLDFLMQHYADTGAELAQASSVRSLARLVTSLEVPSTPA